MPDSNTTSSSITVGVCGLNDVNFDVFADKVASTPSMREPVSRLREMHDQCRPLAGLWPVVGAIAPKMKIRCTFAVRSSAQLGVVHAIDRVEPQDPAWQQFAGINSRGLVRHDPGVDVAWLIAQIAMTYPQARIAVMTASRDFADQLISRMRRCTSILNDMYDHGDGELGIPRVVIGVTCDFADGNLEFTQRDILIFPRAKDGIHERSVDALANPDNRFRVFGFLRSDIRVARSEEWRLRGLFGFTEMEIPAHGREVIPVKVAHIRYAAASHLAHGSTLGLLRSRIWKNHCRNEFVADIGKDQHRRRMEPFTGFSGTGKSSQTEPPGIVLATDSVEHAVRIHRKLTGWPVITRREINIDGLPDHDKRSISSGAARWTAQNKVIATLDGLGRVTPDPSGHVIIWSGSGKSGVVVPRQLRTLPQTADGRERSILVVDIEDDCDGVIGTWSSRRRAAYRERGYLPLTQHSATGRARNFLDRQRRTI